MVNIQPHTKCHWNLVYRHLLLCYHFQCFFWWAGCGNVMWLNYFLSICIVVYCYCYVVTDGWVHLVSICSWLPAGWVECVMSIHLSSLVCLVYYSFNVCVCVYIYIYIYNSLGHNFSWVTSAKTHAWIKLSKGAWGKLVIWSEVDVRTLV
jgi:hypothetical protein